MNKIWIKEYKDGLAFNIGDYEVAFYCNITDWITYSAFGIEKAHPGHKSYNCISLPYEENRFIMDEMRRYKRALECPALQEKNDE